MMLVDTADSNMDDDMIPVLLEAGEVDADNDFCRRVAGNYIWICFQIANILG